MLRITEEYVKGAIIDFLSEKENGDWHREKVKKSKLHGPGADIYMVGGKRNSGILL